MRWCTHLALYVLVSAISAETQDGKESRTVHISQGAVKGYKESDGVYAFYGIPYATAPTGIDKFKAPKPGPAWLQPLEAVDKGIVCPQVMFGGIISENHTMQEDCLIANVYVPDTEETNLPVVVYVHGGAFQTGFGNYLTQKNFTKRKIIAVNFNYRLGVHGFLCLGTKDAPGNAGMKDQVALLRWVKKNIASFGGNPDDITIAGYSAGSVSVDLLMLSKSANGLFNKVIPESGTNLAIFATQQKPLEAAKWFARELNFTNADDLYALEEFYKTTPLEKLTIQDILIRIDSLMFTPCVERNVGEEMFLEEAPINIIKSGKYNKVPMLYGIANMEGFMRIHLFELWKNKMNEKFSNFLPNDLYFESNEEKEEVAKRVKKFYFGDKPVDNDTVLSYVDFFTDTYFAYSTLKVVKLHLEANHDQIYLYEYNFVDDSIPLVPHTNVRGANHCAQSFAVLDPSIFISSDETETEDYKKMRSIMRELWSNFILNGKPVPEDSELPAWPPVGANHTPYMALNLEMQLKSELLQQRFLFWEELYQKYYRAPTPPPKPTHTEL